MAFGHIAPVDSYQLLKRVPVAPDKAKPQKGNDLNHDNIAQRIGGCPKIVNADCKSCHGKNYGNAKADELPDGQASKDFFVILGYLEIDFCGNQARHLLSAGATNRRTGRYTELVMAFAKRLLIIMATNNITLLPSNAQD